jgi:nucleotide-binding universal stress UspA family protein
MFERILVPLDGSKNAEMVLPYVEEIAGRFRSQLSLVGVIENDNTPITLTGVKNNDVLYMYLAQIAKQAAEQGKEFGIESSQQIAFKLLSGHIAQKILLYSEEINADLIGLTSRGASSHEKWVLGNISAKVLRATRKPVLLVRRRVDDKTLGEKRLIKRILLPLDGSKIGESAIRVSEALAMKLNAQIVLIHVLEPLIKFGIYDTNPSIPAMDNLISRQVEAQAYLDKVIGLLKERTGIVSESNLVVGYPANEIADYAQNHDIDLIAISTHGRTGLQQWVFGSVTDKLLHFGDTPLLVVRPSET